VDLSGLLEKTVGGLGYEFVDVELANHGRLMRIFIDKVGGVNVDDCAAVSNYLTRVFAVENVDYDRLEISSPGLDRPLKRAKDFERFSGERVQVKLRIPINGRKRVAGVLQNVREDGFELDVDGELLSIAFADINKARLVPNIDWRIQK
jgi:ribosome maturation factor RimP